MFIVINVMIMIKKNVLPSYEKLEEALFQLFCSANKTEYIYRYLHYNNEILG